MAATLQENLAASAAEVKKLAGRDTLPETLVVLGSGFKNFEKAIKDPVIIPLEKIKHFPVPKVAGHGNNLIVGRVNGSELCVLTGRVHMYEGHSANDVVYYVRTFALAGIKKVLLTNASGSVNPAIKPGDVLSITDHINLTGRTCLSEEGLNLGKELFIDMSECYDRNWQKSIQDLGGTKPGVYVGLIGPAYETPAEARMLGRLGADAVGMSTVQEALAARQLGLKVAGLSLVTNMSGGLGDSVNHQEVLDLANDNAERLAKLLTAAVSIH